MEKVDMIIHLNGWPGVGKMTIGQELANDLGARFIHNHTLHDVAFACAGYGDKDRWLLYDKVRQAAYQVLENRPTSETFVMTNALCKESEKEIEAWEHVVHLAVARNVVLIPVVLNASQEEISKRIASPNRLKTKLKEPAGLSSMMEEYTLQIPNVRETILLNVNALSAKQAAEDIQLAVTDISKRASPATLKHLMLK